MHRTETRYHPQRHPWWQKTDRSFVCSHWFGCILHMRLHEHRKKIYSPFLLAALTHRILRLLWTECVLHWLLLWVQLVPHRLWDLRHTKRLKRSETTAVKYIPEPTQWQCHSAHTQSIAVSISKSLYRRMRFQHSCRCTLCRQALLLLHRHEIWNTFDEAH